MFKRGRWKPVAALAILLVAGVVGLCFILGKSEVRTQVVSHVDSKSGYRCRFTMSSDWKPKKRDFGMGVPLELNLFTLPPTPIRSWINSHILHRLAPDPPEIDLLDGKINAFNGTAKIVDGYPELPAAGPGQILSHRHIRIDGNPATVFTGSYVNSGKSYYGTTLLVYVPNESLMYIVGGGASVSDAAPVNREMQAIISSFHVEKVPVPTGGKH